MFGEAAVLEGAEEVEEAAPESSSGDAEAVDSEAVVAAPPEVAVRAAAGLPAASADETCEGAEERRRAWRGVEASAAGSALASCGTSSWKVGAAGAGS
ncbi:hypothetical protein GCM10023159_17130 [Brevibacterium yomogidense]